MEIIFSNFWFFNFLIFDANHKICDNRYIMANAIWTEEKVLQAVTDFISKNNREPSHDDYLNDPTLPHPRVIQRRFHGLKGLRTRLGLNTIDYTKGDIRGDIAKKSLNTSRQMEAKIFNALFEKYDNFLKERGDEGIVQVSRQFQYQQYIKEANYYAQTSVDMAISFRDKRHVVMIDIFHPDKVTSLQGCVSVKKKKTEKHPVKLVTGVTHELLFVCTNPKITQEEIDKHVKKNKMYTVLSYETFKRDILD